MHAARAVDPQQIVAYFQQNLSAGSEVVVPGQGNWTADFTQRWNGLYEPSYVVAVKPALEADIQEIISYASQNHVPFMGTGGGHGYTSTTARLQNGIDIDLGAFRQVNVSAAENTVTIGGMVGVTLGGGVGPLQGLYGLIMDSLVSVRLVTGKGELVTASATENTELFWGVRGGGIHLGLVTSATYKIYDVGDKAHNGQALNADMFFSADKNASVFQLLESLAGKQPDTYSIVSGILWSDDFNASVIVVNTVYWGPEDEGAILNQPFLDIGPLVKNITVLPWNRLTKENRFGGNSIDCAPQAEGVERTILGLNLYSLKASIFTDVLADYDRFYLENPALRPSSMLAIEMHPRRVTMQIPDSATAYPYRETLGMNIISIVMPDRSFLATVEKFATSIRQKLSPMSGAKGLEVYVNYAHGDEGPVAWYGENLGRLRQLKSEWDPSVLFNWTNGIAA
ncbi:polyketide synthase protein [Apiospora kogelbergensis]|uniref:polyketide synthase protein n=1 Tax=Apiospora kogelbergensis TaxID=1337665 RepID=UPI0031309A84